MLKFYRDAFIVLLVTAAITWLVGFYAISHSEYAVPLLPKEKSLLPWNYSLVPSEAGGDIAMTLLESEANIAYQFQLPTNRPFPYSAFNFNFTDLAGQKRLVDLRSYRDVALKIKCVPANILLLVLFTHDNAVTDPGSDPTRRVASSFFSCGEQFETITIPFSQLDTPDWWLQRYRRDLVDRKYRLDQAYGFALVNSVQSPLATVSQVEVSEFNLRGKNNSIVSLFVTIFGVLWIVVITLLIKRYIREVVQQVKEKVRQDRPLIAYKELSISPQKDKEKSAVLRYLATEYANPDLSLELAVEALGVNRTKINDILKAELGLTFSAYLNKLRLTEAARLLSENDNANVSEIAYSVGYNNASYFNKLFKAEYGCTPKAFQGMFCEQS